MSGRLVYVVGPSGAGKDSVLEHARARLTANAGIIFARRFITREPSADGEQHIPVSTLDFERLCIQGHFALQWDANGLRYGIGQEIHGWLAQGFHVVVNGSREYAPQAVNRFPEALVVCITASPETIRQRLHQRARESNQDIEDRLLRTSRINIPSGIDSISIINDGPLEAAGSAMLHLLESLNKKYPAH